MDTGPDHRWRAPEAERSPSTRPPGPAAAGPSAPTGTSLRLGAIDDPAERAADDIAGAVVRRLVSTGAGRVRRSTRPASEEDQDRGSARVQRIHRASHGPSGAGPVDADLSRRIQRARPGGSPMPERVRNTMEHGFGADLSAVRFHSGRTSDDLNERLHASAFTIGRDVFFRGGVPDTDSHDGRRLVAHELAHTLQAGQAGSVPVRRQHESREELLGVVDRRVGEIRERAARIPADTGDGLVEAIRQDILDTAVRLEKQRKKAGRSQKAAEAVYADAQQEHARVLRLTVGKKIISARVGSEDEGEEAFAFVTMDVDDRVARLVALLSDKEGTKGEDRLRSLMHLVAGGDRAQLEARYQLVRGRTIVQDIEQTYKGMPLRIAYLRQLLKDGRPSPEGQLALKLGLLRGRYTGFDIKDKQRIRELVRERPTAFTWLTDPRTGGGPNEFRRKVLATLADKGFLGELRAFLAMKDTTGATKGPTYAASSDPDANYLLSLVYNQELKVVDEYGIESDIRRNESFWGGRTKGLKDSTMEWVQTMADEEARKAFVRAGLTRYEMTDPAAPAADGTRVKAFEAFWDEVYYTGAMAAAKARFLIRIAAGKGDGATTDPENRLNELEATLQFHADDKYFFTKRMARSDMKHFVMRLLSVSSTSGFDPVTAIVERYAPGEFAKLSKEQDQVKKLKLRRQAFGVAWPSFSKLLDNAKLTGDQKIQVQQFLLEGGSETEKGDNELGVYLKLKKKERESDFLRVHADVWGDTEPPPNSKSRVLELMATVEPGSDQATLIKGDQSLCRFLDWMMSWSPGKEVLWKRLRDDATKGKDSADYWAARLATSYKLDHDGNRGLEIAFQAQQAGAPATDISDKLQQLHPEAYRVMAERGSRFKVLSPIGKRFDHRGERSAFKVLHLWLKGERKEITAEDLFHASRAVTKFGAEGEAVDFALGAITAENVFDYVDKGTLTSLQKLADDRFEKRLELQGRQQQRYRNNDAATEQRLQEEIAELSLKIQRHDVEISGALVKKMGKVMRKGALAGAKRRIYGLMGIALGADVDDDTETSDHVKSLKLNESELGFKGAQMTAKSEVLEQRSLESGVTWDHRTTIAAQTSEQLGMMMGKVRTTERELLRINALEKLTEADRAKQRSLLQELKSAQADVRTYQKDFKAAQDRLNEQTTRIVTTLLALAISVAGLATGLGAALGVIQLAWAIGASLLQSAVKLAMEAGLGRESEHSGKEAAKQVIVKLFSDVLASTMAAELTLQIDLAGIGLHQGGWADQLFGKPALAMAKSQVSGAIGSVPSHIEKAIFAKHPVQGMMPAIRQGIIDKAKALPTEAITTYVSAFAAEGARQGGKELFTAMGIEAAAWTPSGSLGGNKYLEGDAASTAQAQMFGRQQGDTSSNAVRGDVANWFNSWGIFVGSPTSQVGADTTLLAPGGGMWGYRELEGGGKEYSPSLVSGYVLNSLKTVFYEEFLIARITSKASEGAEHLTGGITGQQREGTSDDYGIERPKKKKESADGDTGPDVASAIWDDTAPLPVVKVDAPPTAERLMARKYRDWGLRIEGDHDSAIRVAFVVQMDDTVAAQDAIMQYETERDATVDLIDELNKRIANRAKPAERKSSSKSRQKSKKQLSSTEHPVTL